jgi:hypothetical protein
MGLGRESCVPPGPRLSPLNVSRPSASNGHAWIPAEQNTFGALALTLGIIRASSRRAALRSSPRNGTASGPLTGGWTRHRRAAPRQSPTRAPQRASDRARWSTSDTEEDGAAAGPPMGGRAAVERILDGALPAQPWWVPSPLPPAVARDLPTRLTYPWPTVVCEVKQVSV